MNQLEDQVKQLFAELDSLMDKFPGNIERLKDCTLREQWRLDSGYTFEDIDLDEGVWKDTLQMLANEEDEIGDWAKDYLIPVGLTKFVVQIKYPLVYERIEKVGGWK